ncbi:MAG: GTP-binding protein [Alsobacter sp.]
MAETVTGPLPLGILTGFLGAGKTTLLNRLLQDEALADTVFIINEFGSVGLDHLFIEASGEDLVLLSSGCLCCTVRGDLVATLEDLLAKRDAGTIPPFRRAMIETTGLADPAPVLQAVLGHPVLNRRWSIDGVVAVVDAVNGMATLDEHAEAVKQAAVADRIVLTKTDLVGAEGEAGLARLVARLRRLNPGAPLLDAAAGEATASALLDAGPFDPSGKIADVARWLRAEEIAEAAGHAGHDHAKAGEGQDAHDVDRHDDRVRSFAIVSDAALPAGALDMFLTLLPATHGARLLRVKGLVRVAEEPERPVLVHGVQHLFHPPVLLSRWPDADRRTRLVFIVRDLDESYVRGLWEAFANVPAIDRPDRAALTDNPLSLRGR